MPLFAAETESNKRVLSAVSVLCICSILSDSTATLGRYLSKKAQKIPKTVTYANLVPSAFITYEIIRFKHTDARCLMDLTN